MIYLCHKVNVKSTFFEDICKRSARFVISCLQSKIPLVRSVARFGVLANRCVSPLGRNALYCCSYFGWRFDTFGNGDISMSNNVFLNLFHQSVSESDWSHYTYFTSSVTHSRWYLCFVLL